MTFRFLAPLPDGTLADIALDAITLGAAFEKFRAKDLTRGWYAVWCGRRLAGHVRIDEDGAVLTDLKTEQPSHANPFACGD